MSRPFRQALPRGLLSGAIFGALQGLSDQSIRRGAVSGLMYGIIFTALRYAGLRANDHLAGLSPREQRMVIAAVRRGVPVADPSLASDAVRHAQKVQTAGGQRLATTLAWGLLVTSALALALSVATDYTPGVIVSAFSSAVWVAILVVGPKLEGRPRERARAAERANRQVARPPIGGAGSDWSRPLR